jgi:hypothetical protein
MTSVTESDKATGGDLPKVVDAVRADLAKWGPKVANTGLAALALNGAARLDDPDLSPTPASMILAQVRETLVKLAVLAAEVAEPDADEIDQINRDHEQRRDAHSA